MEHRDQESSRRVAVVRSSSWRAIALLMPLLAGAVMCVVYLRDERRPMLPADPLVAVAPAPVVPDAQIGEQGPNLRQPSENVDLVKKREPALVFPAPDPVPGDLAARFDQARKDYQDARLLREGVPERTRLLESALEGFQDIGLDYPDMVANYQGIIYQGLCHEALGFPDDALVDYEDAVALREMFVVEEGVYQVGPREADVVSGATLQRVRLLTRLERTREAIAAAQDFLATIPRARLTSSGPEILAAKARAESAGASAR